MFQNEIKFITDFTLNKIKDLGSFFTIEKILSAEIHPCIKKYVEAEIDFLIYEDRKKLLENSMFDYSGSKISKHFNSIGLEIKKSKKVSFEDMKKLVLQAVSFNANYVVRPKWSLTKLIFGNTKTVSVTELNLLFNYTHYYEYIQNVLNAYTSKKKITNVSITEFELILNKIDRELFSLHTDKLIDDALYSIADFFSIGALNKSFVSVDPIELFLKEKNLLDQLINLRRVFPSNIKKKISIDDIKKAIYKSGPISPESLEEKEESEEISSDEIEKPVDAIDEEKPAEKEIKEELKTKPDELEIEFEAEIREEVKEEKLYDENEPEENLEPEATESGEDEIDEENSVPITEEEVEEEKIPLDEVEEEKTEEILSDLTEEIEEQIEEEKIETLTEEEEKQLLEFYDKELGESLVEDKDLIEDESVEEIKKEMDELLKDADVTESEEELEIEEEIEIEDDADPDEKTVEEFKFQTDEPERTLEFEDAENDINDKDDELLIEEIETSGHQIPKRSNDIFSYLSDKEVDKIIKGVFNSDSEDFTNTVEKVSECENYEDAIEILKSVFSSYKVGFYSKEAVMFTNAVSRYFSQD